MIGFRIDDDNKEDHSRFGVEIKVVTESEVAKSLSFRIIRQVSEQDLRVLERAKQLPC